MKEATGELSGTVITVVAIAAVLVIFTTIILPMIRRNIALSTACSSAGDGAYEQTLPSGDIIKCSADGDAVKCEYQSSDGEGLSSKTCKTE